MNDMAREKGDMYAAFVTQELGQGSIVSASCLSERGLTRMLLTELRDLLSGKAVYEPDENLDNGTRDDEDHPPPKASKRQKSSTTEPIGNKKKSSQKSRKLKTDTFTNEKMNSNIQAGQKEPLSNVSMLPLHPDG
jgi:hypothetical protein